MHLTPYAIFDLDGTLLDSNDMWESVTDRVLSRYGRTITPQQRMDNMTLTIDGAADYFVRELGVQDTPAACAELMRREAQRGYAERARVKPGVPEMLRAMQARAVRMCVASGTEKPLVDDALKAHGLLGFFEFTLSCDNPEGKRRPDVYRRARERFGVSDPGCVTVFEDSLTALRTAAGDGFHTVGIFDAPTAGCWPQIQATAEIACRTWDEWTCRL
ncbi:MAG: HAD family phosphatase [Gemmiger sp.]|uniref:HAD family hydrolase n=1 Tax=Gemmiger sp. TaxID=2049027 RepID=UPI002E7A9F2D|nr:HAD family phosphatase [Gemmiger sp.]MEE0800250.1 HAD family phosphatase [Gemmiger sp.]